MKWRNISLEQFQFINAINDNHDFDELDKVMHTTLVVFNKTENEAVKMGVVKMRDMSEKTTNLFAKPFSPTKYSRIGYYILNYNIEKLRFGQYIELNYFLQKDPIENAHYILASIAHLPLLNNNSKRHEAVRLCFLKKPISKIAGSLAHLIERFSEFNKEYSGLFDINDEGEVPYSDPFNKNYGWIYSATQVAEHERVTLEEAFDIPVRQALNDLSYLKAKKQYDENQLKKHGAIN